MDLLTLRRLNNLAPNSLTVPQSLSYSSDPSSSSDSDPDYDPGYVSQAVQGNEENINKLAPPDIQSPFDKLANTPTPIYDRYSQALMHPPDPRNYQPGVGRKILAGFAALSGRPGASESVLDQPYTSAMSKYAQQVGLLGQGAQQEERDLSNKRGLAVAQAQNDLRNWEAAVRQQQADTAYQKERDIWTSKQNELQLNIQKLDQQLGIAQQRLLQSNENSAERNQLLAGTQELMRQRIELERQLGEARLNSTNQQHDAERQHWNAQDAATKARVDAYVKNFQDLRDGKITIKDLFDDQNNLVGSVRTTTQSGGGNNQAPPMASRVKGQTKFNVPGVGPSTWDGEGWVPDSK